MATKPVSLSLHRNTIEKKQKHELAQRVQKETAKICRDCDIRAFAFVGIDVNGEAHAIWDTGAIIPMWAMGSVVGKVLDADVLNSGVEEDFRAPIRKPETP